MIRTRFRIAASVAAVAILALGACGGGGGASETEGQGPSGDPVSGGTANLLLDEEPRSLDPAIMANVWVLNAAVGNSLYGALLTNDRKTAELGPGLATSFESNDNGKTFELKLREGLEFSDGSPLTAEDVKFCWDRIKDPETGSSSVREASLIESTEVVDDRTLKVTLVTPIPKFGMAVVSSSLNWVASADALKKGTQSFDQNPIGAGPFTLKSWTRQDKIELVKNPSYYDAPKPYLDAVTMRSTHDAAQRLNAVTGGTVDLAMETGWENLAKAREQGLQIDVVELGGGQAFFMNMRKEPFDDARARQAISAALDLDAIDTAIYNGKGEIPRTLLKESSPFYSGVQLANHDKAEAQRLFDELAAEGKPVAFTFTTFPSTEATRAAESVQAQLSAFKNVDVKIRTIDIAESSRVYVEHDFEMAISAMNLVDPEPQIWQVLHSGSPSNYSGVEDQQLDAALEAGRTGETVEERKTAYRTVSERLAELQPMVFYTRASPSVMAADNVGGITMYGMGSLLTEELWIE